VAARVGVAVAVSTRLAWVVTADLPGADGAVFTLSSGWASDQIDEETTVALVRAVEDGLRRGGFRPEVQFTRTEPWEPS
jgi:hypothetical protein